MQSASFGDHRVIARLGRGGMADVFLAMRRGPAGFSKLVVIKQLRDDLAALAEGISYRELLLDEARLAARLQHPNIVQTFEVGELEGVPYLAMEYLDGQPLDRVLVAAQKAYVELPVELVLRLLCDVLAGLEYAHELADYDGAPLGIVHRDVSPHNVFWTYQGEIKLVDFGVAKYAHSSAETDAGLVKGKLTYMAPEQALRSGLDRRSDLFPVGILMWECLASRPLMPRNHPAAALKKLLYDPFPSLAEVRPDLTPAIAAICERALQRDPARRYQRAGEMRAELEQVLGGSGPQRDELSRFVQRLFERERAVVAKQIKDAMAGEGVVDLASSQTSSSTVGMRPRSSSTGIRTGALPVARARAESGELGYAAASSSIDGLAPPPASPADPQRPPAVGASGPAAPASPEARSLAAPRRSWRGAAIGLGLLGAMGLALLAGGVFSSDPSGAGAASGVVGASAATVAVAAGAAEGTAGAATLAGPTLALRLCGSNTVGAELAPALVESFLQRKGGTQLARAAGAGAEQRTVTAVVDGKPLTIAIESRGTSTAFEELADGSCDIGMASRAIDDQEVAKLQAAGLGDLRAPASEHVLALDGIAVVVHPNNPLRALDRGALHDIFTGRVVDWSAVGGAPGPIRVLARDDKSGTFDTFKHLVLGKDKLVAEARRFVQSDALADAVAGDPSAIGFIGLAYVRSAKALAVAEPGATPMLPTSFTVATEGYMLSRRLYFYTTPRPRSPLVAELVSHALSPRGQQVVNAAQFVDLGLTLRDEPCDERCPRAYASAVSRAQRVSVDFRFRSGSGEADSRAVRDLDRLVALLHEHRGARLILLGFSDSDGGSRQNAALSLERARAIERELTTRGVRTHVVKGLGDVMPVASNATESGRERNRRVEVWLVR